MEAATARERSFERRSRRFKNRSLAVAALNGACLLSLLCRVPLTGASDRGAYLASAGGPAGGAGGRRTSICTSPSGAVEGRNRPRPAREK